MSHLPPVCILTAGQGTRMGPLAEVINKSLVPYKGKAIISHIIALFPQNTPFVIALGYKEQQVRDYLQIAHPEVNFSFVVVDKYIGEGTGPGYSLNCCRDFLKREFYFISCDTLIEMDLSTVSSKCNWVGVSSVTNNLQIDYCNMVVSDEKVIGIFDKQKTELESYAFSGFMYIYDYNLFWSSLAVDVSNSKEHQVSNGLLGILNKSTLKYAIVDWIDLGTYDKYRVAVEQTEAYDFSKTNEFLYFVNQQVIKFFSNSSIIDGRVKKASLKPEVFPRINEFTEHWYSYSFLKGNTLYENNNPQLFDKLLLWLEKDLWTSRPDVLENEMISLCQEFYKNKTFSRLADYDKKYPSSTVCSYVNGRKVASIDSLMKKIPWSELLLGVPTFIHGDLQFDNILYDKDSDSFVLLDWRQDFAGEVSFGDIYYDLAKLMGGILINYDYIKLGLMSVVEEEDDLLVDFAQRYNSRFYLASLNKHIVSRGYDVRRVQIIIGLIYLNMSPLHHPPFDKALHGLGRLILTEILIDNQQSIFFNDSTSVIPCLV